MTEERKQELGQLLAEATSNLKILFGCGGSTFRPMLEIFGYHGSTSIPVDVYRKYLQRHWTSYGVGFPSFWFPSLFMPHIVDKTIESKLLDFIRKELAPLIDRDCVISVTYAIPSEPTNTSRSLPLAICFPYLYSILTRLLEIAIGRGIEEAVSTLDRFSSPKGVHGLFRHIALLDGIHVPEPVQITEGVRLIPLPFGESPEELKQYLPGFLDGNYGRLPTSIDKALLIIDCPGFSIFYKPSTDSSSPPGIPDTDFPYDAPPFRFESHNTRFPNFNLHDFCETFCQALSLVYNFPVQIVHTRWFCEEDKSFNETRDAIGMPGELSSFKGYGTTGDIEEAKDLYDTLCENSEIKEKLRIPIDRWIKSKAGEDPVDKMIDLGIALESLYLSNISEPIELAFRLRLHAAWYLRENEKDRKTLMKEFAEIYNWRSKVVHTGKLPTKKKNRPYTKEEVGKFTTRAQDLCRESIMKVLEDEQFPNWNNLILSGEGEQASS